MRQDDDGEPEENQESSFSFELALKIRAESRQELISLKLPPLFDPVMLIPPIVAIQTHLLDIQIHLAI